MSGYQGITLPCGKCQAPVLLPADDGPLECASCGATTPVRWFQGARPLLQWWRWYRTEQLFASRKVA